MADGGNVVIRLASEFIDKGVNAMKAAFQSATGAVKSFGSKLLSNLANIKAGFDIATGCVQRMAQLFTTAFKYETQTVQFQRLIGDIDSARDHMEMLKNLGDTPPFSLDAFAAASRTLMVLTDGALGFQHSLELVGDAAAGTGQPIESVSNAVGRLYSSIRDGQPISRAAMALSHMGILTPGVVEELGKMQESGRATADIWEKVEKALGNYSGAMEDAENTGEGLMGAISSRWDNLVRQFGDAFSGAAKGGMSRILEKMKDLEESGTIQNWAEKAVRAIEKVMSALSKLGDLWDRWTDFGERIGDAVGGVIGGLRGGGSLGDALEMGRDTYRDSGRKQEVLRADAAREAAAKKEAARQKAAADAEAKRKEAEARERDRLEEDFKEADWKNAAKRDAENQRFQQQINDWLSDTQARLDKEELERQKRDIGDEMDAERDRAAQEQQLFQKKIADLLQEIADIEKNREKTSRGMGVDAGRNQWGQYQYHFDKDGKISFSEWQRTRRYGDETSDEAKARRRREIEDKRMEELEDKWKSGKKLSDSEMKKLGAWWDYQEEVNGKDKKQAQIEKLQQEMANAAKKSEQHLKDLDDKMKKLVEEGPLD